MKRISSTIFLPSRLGSKRNSRLTGSSLATGFHNSLASSFAATTLFESRVSSSDFTTLATTTHSAHEERRRVSQLQHPSNDFSTSSIPASSICSSSGEKRGIHDNAKQMMDADNELLSSIAQEAELASTQLSKVGRGTKRTSPSIEDARKAAKAAQTLLTLTRTVDVSSLMGQEDATRCNQNEPTIQSLHRAFISVTSWCINTIPADPLLILVSLDLARKCSIELSLPLHLPLYRKLAKSIAIFSPPDCDLSTAAATPKETGGFAADMILETSKWVQHTLGMPLETSFFCEPLLCLVKRNQLKQAMKILLRMEPKVDKDRALDRTFCEIMSHFSNDSLWNEIENDDVLELLLMVHRFSVELEHPYHSQTLGEAICQSLRYEDRELELLIDLTSLSSNHYPPVVLKDIGSYCDDKRSSVFDLPEIIDSMIIANGKSASNMKTELQKILTKVNIIRNSPCPFPQARPPSESASFFEKYDYTRRLSGLVSSNAYESIEDIMRHIHPSSSIASSGDESFMKDQIIYTRDCFTDDDEWKLPDITSQIEGIKYTSAYEDKILKDYTEETAEEDASDGNY